MSTLKTVANKLFKTELANHKVELALTDDIQKAIEAANKALVETKAANKAMNDSAALSKKILKDAIDADSVYDKAAALNDKAVKNGNAQVDKALNMVKKVDQAASTLGLKGSAVDGYAQLEKLVNELEDEVSYADKDAFKDHPGWISKN
jgi:cell division protein FtsB